jgi:hypothetical protein
MHLKRTPEELADALLSMRSEPLPVDDARTQLVAFFYDLERELSKTEIPSWRHDPTANEHFRERFRLYHGAATPEPPPVANNNEPVWSMVVSDMLARDKMGIEKYGLPLRPFDGRDSLWDAYQEALDLAVYLRKAIYERDNLGPKISKQIEEIRPIWQNDINTIRGYYDLPPFMNQLKNIIKKDPDEPKRED